MAAYPPQTYHILAVSLLGEAVTHRQGDLCFGSAKQHELFIQNASLATINATHCRQHEPNLVASAAMAVMSAGTMLCATSMSRGTGSIGESLRTTVEPSSGFHTGT